MCRHVSPNGLPYFSIWRQLSETQCYMCSMEGVALAKSLITDYKNFDTKGWTLSIYVKLQETCEGVVKQLETNRGLTVEEALLNL